MPWRCWTCQCKKRCQVRNSARRREDVKGTDSNGNETTFACKGCCRLPIQKHYLIRIRHLLYLFLAVVLAGGVVGPFVMQCIEHNVDNEKALSIWNGYVSIALGFVATTLSIVSLALNFKTYDDALEVQRSAVKTLESVETIKQDIKKVNSSLQGSSGSTVQSTTAKSNPEPSPPVDEE